ncbi:hypothetical protein QTJ10_10965 [Xanthomonas hortorum pv. vitians]|uniref:hypothetical protein n=1 Tax=Xanthomonas hortorum TaxID=56454 RepID=UPI0025A199AB|nr:hypothetical protein [Xanthomonas hortorum]WJM78530.1 hypothetical protein QTJ10_10965 [Xanthomonas hortorum pv. vitians]
MSNRKMTIKDALGVRSRYVRAVNISRDLDDVGALEGYLITDGVRQALARLSKGLAAASTQRAWRVTGSYGSGKSAFGLLLANLFSQPLTKKGTAGAVLDEQAKDLLPDLRKMPRYEVLVITGAKEDASVALARALDELLARRRTSSSQKQLRSRLSDFIQSRQTGKGSASEVLELLGEVRALIASATIASEGLLILVDEMGRWLEYAAAPDSKIDASFFQALAEQCGGRVDDIPVAVIGFLHQRFDDYASGRRDRRAGLEWAKVAERFEDISFVQTFESTAKLIARALEADRAAYKRSGVSARSKELYMQASKMGLMDSGLLKGEGISGESLYPLHPTALLSAVSMFRRFGQNERSTFSFLLASEPFAFQDYIRRRNLDPGEWYRITDLCDWLLAQGTLRTLDEERLKRWSLLQETLRSAPVYETEELMCLKAVGLLNLLEPQPGLPVTFANLSFALDDRVDSPAIAEAVEKLIQKSLLYVRPATQELCLWPQSSVDVASEYSRIRKGLQPAQRLGSLLQHLPGARPMVAHRHYFETGTLRTAQIHLFDEITQIYGRAEQAINGDAEILIIPCYPDQDAAFLGRQLEAMSASSVPGRLFALRKVSEDDLELADDLAAWTQLENECADLRVDTYARNEVKQSIHRVTANISLRLADLRVPGQGTDGVIWWHLGERLDITSGRQLNQQLSTILDDLYAQAPRVRNELINRTAISSAAAAARQRLLERMFANADEADLGIQQTPPEMAIYLSLFKDTGLHRADGAAWRFQAPKPGSDWMPAWNALGEMLDTKGLVTIRQVMDHLTDAPFGMRHSVSLLLIAAFLSVNRDAIILRERGSYLTVLEDSHLGRLVKKPEAFELHMIHAQSSTASVLTMYQTVLQKHLGSAAVGATVAEITRAIYDWYLTLPEHTLNSTKLDASHRAVLALLNKASDPIELLTVTIPLALGAIKVREPIDGKSKVAVEVLRAHFEGMLRAGSGRLNDLRSEITLVLAEEVGVRDVADVRPHIIALSEGAMGEVVDYALKSFMQRSMDGQRDDRQWIDSLASLLGGRSIDTWHDETIVRFRGEVRRVYTLLTRVVALNKLTGASKSPDHAAVAVHVVDQKGKERFVAVPADAEGLLRSEDMADLRAALSRLPVPAYALARLLLEFSSDLPATQPESVA